MSSVPVPSSHTLWSTAGQDTMRGPEDRTAGPCVLDIRPAWEGRSAFPGRSARGRAWIGGGRRVRTLGELAPKVAGLGRLAACSSAPKREETLADGAVSSRDRVASHEWPARTAGETDCGRRAVAPTREGSMTTVVVPAVWIASASLREASTARRGLVRYPSGFGVWRMW